MTEEENSFHSHFNHCISDQIDETLSWLNLFQPGGSAITPDVLKYLLEALRTDISLKEVIGNVKKAIAESQKMEDSLETPEIWVRGAVLFYKRGLVDDAIKLMHQALPLYVRSGERVYPATGQKVGPHRAAIVRWLLLLMALAKNDRTQALTYCAATRADLRICRAATLEEKNRELYDPANRKMIWYDQRLEDLDVEEALIPEHVIGWLRMYSTLDAARAALMSQGLVMEPSPGALSLVNKIYQEIQTNQPKDAIIAEIERLISLSERENYSESRAYLLAHAGMAYFKLGDSSSGLACIRKAKVFCNRAGVSEAVLTWLIGLFEWYDPTLRVNAETDCQRAVDLMAELSVKADRQDRREAHLWFAARRVAMMKALARLIRCA